MVSIVIPCFNHARFLGEAIRSTEEQGDVEREVIVVDDGSTDATAEVAARFPYVRYLYQRNAGLAAARNTGIGASRGQYLVCLDADDRLLPGALRAGLSALELAADLAFACGDYYNIDLEGRPMGPSGQPALGSDPYVTLLRMNVIVNPATVIYRRWVFDRVGGFDTRCRAAEDYDLYLRITRRYRVVSHPALVSEYRRHGGQMSANFALMLANTVRVLRRQRRWVTRNARRQAAWRKGLAFWRTCYGRPLAWKIEEDLGQQRWRGAARGSVALMRYAPGVVVRGGLHALKRGVGLKGASAA